ncbi:DUF5695 domain-containing protein [Paenibacillus campi]|uniref:DUF5695 domain-containing protein n=1 Tax=Paenibacillus campi TaxID=3106031 RepID=UPI002AFF761F|nr:DUF5695 domain-containing protein [Paenibacillus sp. SGZ-1014]
MMNYDGHGQHNRTRLFVVCLVIVLWVGQLPAFAAAADDNTAATGHTLSGSQLQVQIGNYGEISSLKLTNDLFPTEYVMNKTVTPEQDTYDHQWMGELLFTYRLDGGEWRKASTNQSDDVRRIEQNGQQVTVTYEHSRHADGIRDFRLTETYTIKPDGSLGWTIGIDNTSGRKLEIGDYGLPMPFNEQWNYGDEIYETRVVTHSFVANNSSYITASRPSGLGPYLLFMPDADTGAGLEYQDRWRIEEHPGSKWAWNPGNEGKWIKGLNVFYPHSAVIRSTNRGYLPNTSLVLKPQASSRYGFTFAAVTDEAQMKQTLYTHGLVDMTVVPGMIVPTNQPLQFDLRTSQPIQSVTDERGRTIALDRTAAGDHHIYRWCLDRIGQQNVTVLYGNGKRAVMQFYGIDPVDKALSAHANFMVDHMQWNVPGDMRDKVYDDWMMNTKQKRNAFNGNQFDTPEPWGWGWGDDWGLTHGLFLAEQNRKQPVARQVQSLDDYLETAIWNTLMKDHHNDYLVPNFLTADPTATLTNRGYAYPHVYNTYFDMYRIARDYPGLISYKHDPNTYLLRAYHIMKALYDGPVDYSLATGLMGGQTTPELIAALDREGYVTEADDVREKMERKYANFSANKYPYGSEYSYDNTGEEEVYTLARIKWETGADTDKALEMMREINAKTRASRGQMPVWYYYADPVTNTGDNWFNFQYTTSLAGYTMDNWIREHLAATQPTVAAEQLRLAYASKLANIGAINSGQMSNDPANIGAASWTYQAEKGNQGTNGTGGGHDVPLMNGWRSMTGEADLGLFGALRVLSADVANDPIFGLIGYGADVQDTGNTYQITPTDGVDQKLHVLPLNFGVELARDQYSQAEISKDKRYVRLQMTNTFPAQTHATALELTGLQHSAYRLKINGQAAGTLNAFADRVTLNVYAPTQSHYTIELSATASGSNEAPHVDAGADVQAVAGEPVSLVGTVTDDGLPSGTLHTEWSVVSAPVGGKATFYNANAARTSVTASTYGQYTFRLSATDGSLSSSDTVTVQVYAASPLPPLLAEYPFDEGSGTVASNTYGNKQPALLRNGAAWAAGHTGQAVSLNGQGAYVQLPNGVLGGSHELTLAVWTKAESLQDYSSVFDIGANRFLYLYLAPQVEGHMQFAISNNSSSGEQAVEAPVMQTGVWNHIAVTLSGTTAILYVNGVEAGRNDHITVDPASFGNTTQNYMGKTRYDDPPYHGLIDDFRIYSRALRANEIATLANSASSTAHEVTAKAD